MDKGLKAAQEWAAHRHTRISAFGVCHSTNGHAVTAEFASLDEARRAAREIGRDRFGRPPVIIALTPEGWVFRVEKVMPE